MAIGSQYVRGRGYPKKIPPEYSGVLGVIGSFPSPTIGESAKVSTTPLATEALSESAKASTTPSATEALSESANVTVT